MQDTIVAANASGGRGSFPDAQINSAREDADQSVKPEEADEVFDEFWSLPPEQVGTQLKTLEEAERSRRGSRAASFRAESDHEAPGEHDRGISRLASDVAKKLREAEEEVVRRIENEAREDEIQTEVSEISEQAAQSGRPPEEIVREMETRWGGEMTEDERKALERLTQYQGWPGGMDWGVPGGRVDQVTESQNPGTDAAEKHDPGTLESPQAAEATPGGNVGEGGSKGAVVALPSPKTPLDFDSDASEAGSAATTPREEWSLPTGGGSTVSALSGGDQGTLKRVDSWYGKSFKGKAKDVMESLLKGWWAEYPEWPALV